MPLLKKTILFLLLLQFFGCKREEPADQITNPITSTSLKQIAVYKTSVPEPSGLFYNTKTKTLFTVSDGNSTVYEMDLTGSIIRSFLIQSSDMEGITFSANSDTMYVAEETNQLVTKYLTNGAKLYSFPVNVATLVSHGPEGIALNTTNNHLYVINESDPCMLLEYVNKTEVQRKLINYTLDCSDIYYDSQLDCIWLVSDVSKQMVKLSTSGDLLALFDLPLTKMEGVTVIQDKIYMMNDQTNELYVFQKP
ncbi:MAG: SdiA-regulated domain-containing protein [Melioribacteraceae bacterium]